MSEYVLDAGAGKLQWVVLRRVVLPTLVSGTPDW